MMEPTIQILRELGVPNNQIKSEAFVAAKRAETVPASTESSGISISEAAIAQSSASPGDDLTVPALTLARSGKFLPLVPEKTLLEIAEDAGLTPDYECRSGICGTCKTRLLGGRVTMEIQDALDDAEKSENIILLCQAKATASVTIDA
jgi:ferredoxin